VYYLQQILPSPRRGPPLPFIRSHGVEIQNLGYYVLPRATELIPSLTNPLACCEDVSGPYSPDSAFQSAGFVCGLTGEGANTEFGRWMIGKGMYKHCSNRRKGFSYEVLTGKRGKREEDIELARKLGGVFHQIVLGILLFYSSTHCPTRLFFPCKYLARRISKRLVRYQIPSSLILDSFCGRHTIWGKILIHRGELPPHLPVGEEADSLAGSVKRS
jgi:hypothetical protein